MIAPLSWLKEYVDIKLTPEELGERLTEIGLSTEKITKDGDDVIFELEITPNRPDLLSIIGVAREIAAIEGKMIKFPKISEKLKPNISLPLKIETDSAINPRFTGIIIDGVSVKESPRWLKNRLTQIGQRPINNIVDITNYVMFELGNPIHAFDYDKISGKIMKVHKTKGGERFTSVDGLSYHLPKDTVVISDSEKIIDLCGIKGGLNTATLNSTKTIFIRVPAEIPNLIRKTSMSLGLRSEASSIFERGVNRGGTLDALKRCTELVLEIAGGEIASEIFDIKTENFSPWKINVGFSEIERLLGIYINDKKIFDILKRLNLTPKKFGGKTIEVQIPTYRNDLKIQEDIIEEIARIYGYNNFPKTMIEGVIPIKEIPYFKNFKLEETIKEYLKSVGFSEIYSYSLVSEKDLLGDNINPAKTLRVDNPVSRDFEYLRPTLKINLRKALKQNEVNFEIIDLFEFGKVFLGSSIDNYSEVYYLSGITNKKNFYEVKGILEKLFKILGVEEKTEELIQILEDGIFFELNFTKLEPKINIQKKYVQIPKFPPIFEDISLTVGDRIKTGEMIEEIKKQSHIIKNVMFLEAFEKTKTFHIIYQHEKRNLTNEDVSLIRSRVLKSLRRKFKARLKE